MPHPLTPETFVYGFTPAGDPQISPDGGAHRLHPDDDRSPKHEEGGSHLWLCDVDGGNARQLTWSGERNGGGALVAGRRAGSPSSPTGSTQERASSSCRSTAARRAR